MKASQLLDADRNVACQQTTSILKCQPRGRTIPGCGVSPGSALAMGLNKMALVPHAGESWEDAWTVSGE